MSPVMTVVVRVVASAIAAVLGLALGLLVFIDAPSLTLPVLVGMGIMLLIGGLLQLGLFLLPSVLRGGRKGARVLCAILMLPTPLLCMAQLSDLVRDLGQTGISILAREPRSDLLIDAIAASIVAFYAFAFTMLWRTANARASAA